MEKRIKARCDNCGSKLEFIDKTLIGCTNCRIIWKLYDKSGWYKARREKIPLPSKSKEE